jgi:methyl-accepting chemotaxis protein
LMLLIFSGIIYLFLDSEIQANLFSAHVTYHNMQRMLFPIVLTLELINLVVSTLLLGFFVVLATHKIAGPLYRFKTVMEEIQQGNLAPRAAIRGDDQLQEFSHSIQQMLESLRINCGALKEKCRALEQLQLKGASPQNASKVLQEMQQILEKYRT